MPDVPLDPVGAAVHATVVQGGYSTPAVEAYRILADALRIVGRGDLLDDEWSAGVRVTLAWIDANAADPAVEDEARRFEARSHSPVYGTSDWRQVLEEAVGPDG